MELRHLRYFVAVAEELHFHRAATRLHISQPPLSQQIRALEAEIGVTLLVRNRRRVELTAAGASFLVSARMILEAVDRGAETARRVAAGEIGSLSVGFVGSAMFSPVLPTILRDFASRHPDVDLHLRELPTAEQLDALSHGRIDVGVIRGPLRAATLAPGLELAVIHREHMVVALPEAHLLAAKSRLRASDLQGETFVILRRSEAPGLWTPLASLMGGAGGLPEEVQEVAEMQTIIALVASGFGVSLVPASVGDTDRPGVTFRPLADPSPMIELSLAWASSERSPVLEAFLALAAPDEVANRTP
ncbi:MAG: LysR substrate-binding domain-containing protein [Solirubrobacteraceae bacterium]|jgi:DNA-binding transcriptional LysR family regulator